MGSFLQTQVHFIGFDVIPEKYMINAHGDILMATSTVPQQTLPGPSALPLLGNGANLLKLFRDPCTYSRWLHDTYGDVVAMVARRCLHQLRRARDYPHDCGQRVCDDCDQPLHGHE